MSTSPSSFAPHVARHVRVCGAVQDVISFDKMVEYGTISESDRDQLFVTDDEEEAFVYLRSCLLQDRLVLGDNYVHKSLRKRPRQEAGPVPACEPRSPTKCR